MTVSIEDLESSDDPDYFVEVLRQEDERAGFLKPSFGGNLDSLLTRVYDYYLQKGFAAIILSKIVSLLTTAFLIVFLLILFAFLDFGKLQETYDLSSSVDWNARIHPFIVICLSLFCLHWVWQFGHFIFIDFWSILEIKNWYNHTLHISEGEMPTISWQEIVKRQLRVPHLSLDKDNFSALDLVNRIMRQENYIIGLSNGCLLDCSVKIPGWGRKRVWTKTLEWGLKLSLLNWVFDQHGYIKPDFLRPENTLRLSYELRKRFMFLGLISFFISPFILIFLLFYYFFMYAEELRKSPSIASSRQWSNYAKLKFREFNELPHLYEYRLQASLTPAQNYVAQFSFTQASILIKFFIFLLGSFASVLIVIGFIDEEVLFKTTVYGKTLVWYLGIFGSVLALFRSFVDTKIVMNQANVHMKATAIHTHYLPKLWKTNPGHYQVYEEFVDLFEIRFVGFCLEILSVAFAPFVFLFKYPNVAEELVAFFATNTIEVEGVGHICSFAFFPLKTHGNPKYGANSTASKGQRTKQGKLEKSFINFKVANPDWEPDQGGKELLQNLTKFAKERPDVKQSSIDQHTIFEESGEWGLSTLAASHDLELGTSIFDPETSVHQLQLRFHDYNTRRRYIGGGGGGGDAPSGLKDFGLNYQTDHGS